MKRSAILFLTLLSLKIFAQGSAEMIKQRAQQQRDLNNQQQGVATAAPSAPSASSYTSTPGTPSTQQGINPAQQALIDKLDSDFTSLKSGAVATDAQKQSLQTNLTNLSKSATKPTKAQMTKLSQDLSLALAEKTLSPDVLATLAKNINIVMNCSLLTPAKAQGYVTTVQSLLKNAGISDANSQAVGADLKAIVTQIQNNKPKLYQ